MKNVAIMAGHAWKKGFGLGFRFYTFWKCTKGFGLHVDFANIEFVFSVQYIGVCTCGEAPNETK